MTEDNLGKDNSGNQHPEISPDIKPHLPSLKRSELGENKTTSGTGITPGSGSSPLTADGLRQAESSASHSVQSNEGFWNDESSKVAAKGRGIGFSKVFGKFASNKKVMIGGGSLGAAILVGAVLGFSFISTYTLDTISQDDVSYQSSAEQDVEKHVARKLFTKILCWQNPSSCQDDPEDDTKEPTAEPGETLTDEMENFDISNPAVVDDLGKVGIKVNLNSANEFTGLTDADGNPITADDILNNTDGIFDTIEDGLPEWSVGQLDSFRSFMYDIARADFDIMPNTSGDNVDQDVDKAIDNGAQGEQAAQQAEEEQEESEPSNNAPPDEVNTYQNGQGLSADLVNAEDTVEKDVDSGESVEAAAADAAHDFGVSEVGSATAATAVIDTCMLQKVVTEAADSRLPEIMDLLIRNGTTTESLASQINSGDLTGSEYKQATELYTGNPNAPATNPDGSTDQDDEPFSDSAAWQRITGQTVTAETPDIDSSALPTSTDSVNLVNSMSSDLKIIPGESALCTLSNSPFSFVVSAAGIGAQVFGDGASLGAAQVATTAAITAFQVALLTKILPSIVQYFVPVQLLGQQDSVQRMNDTDAGLNLAYNNYSRSMGGVPQTNSEADQEFSSASTQVADANSRLSLSDKLFNIHNPNSLIAKIGLDIPVGFSSMFSSLSSYLTGGGFIHSILHGLAVDLTPHTYAQGSATNPGQPYGITQYGFDGNENEYDPVANEQYLFSDITYDGQSESRISMLGNPNNFVNSPSGDTDNNDLLHCFVDGYTQLLISGSGTGSSYNFTPGTAASQDQGADENCGVIGTYDYSNDGVGSSNLSTDSNSPSEMPNNYTAASIYCQSLLQSSSNNNQQCINSLLASGQINNDVGRFEQYMVDLHVMNDYTSLISNN